MSYWKAHGGRPREEDEETDPGEGEHDNKEIAHIQYDGFHDDTIGQSLHPDDSSVLTGGSSLPSIQPLKKRVMDRQRNKVIDEKAARREEKKKAAALERAAKKRLREAVKAGTVDRRMTINAFTMHEEEEANQAAALALVPADDDDAIDDSTMDATILERHGIGGDPDDADPDAPSDAAPPPSRPTTAAEDKITQLMLERSAATAENQLVARRAAAALEERLAEEFAPTMAAIDDLILDVSLAVSQPAHINKSINMVSLAAAGPAASGISNFARGSTSSKPGDINDRERRAIVELGAVEPLAMSLHERNGEFLVTHAAEALGNIAIDRRGREVVGQGDAIGRLVGIIANAAHPDASPEARQSDMAEFAAACLRNLALDENNAAKMAACGAIPAMIQLSIDGNAITRGMCACCLACIAKNKRRCEMVCDYGACRPLIKMLGMEEPVCQLSAAGCLNELSRLRRNKEKIKHTGGVEALIKMLDKSGEAMEPHNAQLLQMVQEKCIAVLLNICEEAHLRNHCVKSGAVRAALKQAKSGTSDGKQSAASILVELGKFLTPVERKDSCAAIGNMIDEPLWRVRSAAARATMQLYRNDDEKMMFIEDGNGLLRLMDMTTVGDPRIHENSLGAILSLMENSDVPDMILETGEEGLNKLVRMLPALNMTVRKLAMGIIKCLSIYDLPLIMDNVPLIYHYHIEHPPAELADYIDMFVKKRKEKGYLSRVGHLSDKFTPEELVEYQALFAELDDDASGSIDSDEIGLLVQAMTGEQLPEEKLQELVDEVDKDGSGVIEWDEFLIIMDNIKNGKKMGIGDLLGDALTQGFKRSVVGKGFQKASNYWNRKKIEMQDMLDAEAKDIKDAEDRKRMADKYWEAEKIKRERMREEAKLLSAMQNG